MLLLSSVAAQSANSKTSTSALQMLPFVAAFLPGSRFNLLFIAIVFVFLLMDRTVCTRTSSVIVLLCVERILFASFAQEMVRTRGPRGAPKGTNGAQQDHPWHMADP